MTTATKTPAQVLREQFRAVRLSFHWWGQRRQVEKSVRNQMACAVEAEPDSISASKKLYNPRLAPIAAINSLKTRVQDCWEKSTLPYHEPGVRLLPKTDLATFETQVQDFATELIHRAWDIQEARADIIADAQQRLQKAFNPGNYPLNLANLFGMEWAYPSIDPPADLPSVIYEQQKQALEAKLQEAVQLAEQAFLHELSELVSTLHDKLTPGPDGQKKVFRDTAIGNLTDFFQRFHKLNVTGNDDLEKLVAEATELVSGITPKELRKSNVLRQEVQHGLGQLKDKLTPLVISAPRRKIITPKKPQPQAVSA